jgi:hypothetical protein
MNYCTSKSPKIKNLVGTEVCNSVFVAQVSNLLYRGFPIRRRGYDREIAGWKPATQQVGNLRYKN